MPSTGAALVVHDLKNALGSLEAGLQALAMRPDRARAAAAHRQCRQLRQRLVSYLTLYGHDREGGRLCAHVDDESPAEVMHSLTVRHAEESCPVTLVLQHEAPPAWHFDRHLVILALESALHNALRFARTEVQLFACVDDGHLVFSVLDDGPGPHSAGPVADGATGLGLSLCRAVARAHGTQRSDGGVRLVPRADGGACFELWLAT